MAPKLDIRGRGRALAAGAVRVARSLDCVACRLYLLPSKLARMEIKIELKSAIFGRFPTDAAQVLVTQGLYLSS